MKNPRVFAVFALLVVSAAGAGCRRPSNSRPQSDHSQYLRAFGECAISGYRTFATDADALTTATATLESTPNDANKTAAREAWQRAIDSLEQIEPMKLGPLAPAALPGGLGLHDSIYAWTFFDRCMVDEMLVTKAYETIATALPDRRGMAVIEYLLFHEGSDNGCVATHPINVDGTWAALGDAELTNRKRAFAKAAAADVAVNIHTAVDAWDPAKGNFLAELVNAGRGSKTYQSDLAGVNAVSDAMFMLDYETKDRKLAVPLAISNCTTPTCPEKLESRYAKRSKLHVRNNLVGFRKLLVGCNADGSGVGFDDVLAAHGAASLGPALDADTLAAIAAVDALPYATFEEALEKDPASVRKIYDAIKAITDALKTEFVGVLDLELPKPVAGDAD